jgi:hypothetical protein
MTADATTLFAITVRVTVVAISFLLDLNGISRIQKEAGLQGHG